MTELLDIMNMSIMKTIDIVDNEGGNAKENERGNYDDN